MTTPTGPNFTGVLSSHRAPLMFETTTATDCVCGWNASRWTGRKVWAIHEQLRAHVASELHAELAEWLRSASELSLIAARVQP